MSTTLDESQLARLATFGYLRFPGLFAAEVGAIVAAFEDVWANNGCGRDRRPHTGTRRSVLIPFIDQSEYLAALLDDPRILGLAASLLGPDFNYFTSDGNYYVGDTPWHSDRWRAGNYRILKLAFYLDPVDANSGALRVIPGSHHHTDRYAKLLEEHALECGDTWGIDGSAVPAVALSSQPGDLVVIDQRLKHAAFGGGNRRRMFTINLTERYADADLEQLRDVIADQAIWWVESLYGEPMLRTAGPERMLHLEQVLANQDHLPELVRRDRQKNSAPHHGNAAGTDRAAATGAASGGG